MRNLDSWDEWDPRQTEDKGFWAGLTTIVIIGGWMAICRVIEAVKRWHC